ncbi:hypothetical protein FHR84_003458 [Actinopolyspora biskrensis]|uniref:Uncharacterized protein n=1 Tax=Actinopolyspora biskrensis TaxID=1470178 RepID=A0A852Z2W7_9ACTN|nr:hypothetical protein [Actinopolyspora biskrensis]NYH80109.1 hypothetical protein [Actinopolyspora biskrensis]
MNSAEARGGRAAPVPRACEPVLGALRESDPLRLRGRSGASGAGTASEADPCGS